MRRFLSALADGSRPPMSVKHGVQCQNSEGLEFRVEFASLIIYITGNARLHSQSVLR